MSRGTVGTLHPVVYYAAAPEMRTETRISDAFGCNTPTKEESKSPVMHMHLQRCWKFVMQLLMEIRFACEGFVCALRVGAL